MPKKVEIMAVPDDKIVELRQLFLDKYDREGDKIPGRKLLLEIDRIRDEPTGSVITGCCCYWECVIISRSRASMATINYNVRVELGFHLYIHLRSSGLSERPGVHENQLQVRV